MEQTQQFIDQNAVLFTQASCVICGQTTAGCSIFVPVNVAQDQEQQTKDELNACIIYDEQQNPSLKQSPKQQDQDDDDPDGPDDSGPSPTTA